LRGSCRPVSPAESVRDECRFAADIGAKSLRRLSLATPSLGSFPPVARSRDGPGAVRSPTHRRSESRWLPVCVLPVAPRFHLEQVGYQFSAHEQRVPEGPLLAAILDPRCRSRALCGRAFGLESKILRRSASLPANARRSGRRSLIFLSFPRARTCRRWPCLLAASRKTTSDAAFGAPVRPPSRAKFSFVSVGYKKDF
jgi:hypothetical protein